MIAYLSGTVLKKGERSIVLDVNGVGYFVQVPRVLAVKAYEGQQMNLNVHTNVREDDISLFGFETHAEWEFFKMLLTVSGVGPKSALEILNNPIGKMQNAIAKREIVYLTKVPGIGKKTAERIIVDLAGKIKEDALAGSLESEDKSGNHHEREEIIQALVLLGYSRNHVIQGLRKVPAEIASEEAIIKFFLQNI